MGETWMVDGEALVMMAMIFSNSPSWHDARTEFLVLNRGFWWWRHSGTLSLKTSNPPLFLVHRAYVGEGRGRGCARGGHTTPWRGLAWPAPPGCVGSRDPSPSLLLD